MSGTNTLRKGYTVLTRSATSRQRQELSQLALRSAYRHAYPESAWYDFDEAEKILNRTPAWREYRLSFPITEDSQAS